MLHDLPYPFPVQRVPFGGQVQAVEQVPDTLGLGLADKPSSDRHVVRGYHAERDGLAVRYMLVSDADFDGVADGVPEVKVCPLAGLSLVGGDDGRLYAHVSGDQFRHRAAVTFEQGLGVLLYEIHHRGISDDGVLEALGQAVADLFDRQGFQRGYVDDDRPWLVERPDEVLAGGVVNSCLAAHRGIHGGQQCRGALQPSQASQGGRGDQAGNIAAYPPAKCHNQRAAVHRGFNGKELVEDRLDRCQILVLLAGGKVDDGGGQAG